MALFIFPPVVIDTAGLATEANQEIMITELMDLNSELDSQSTTLTSIDSKDFATEATQATLATEATQATLATESTVSTLGTETTLATRATEATLSSLNTKVTAVDTTDKSTETKQDDQITELQAVNTELDSQTTELQTLNTSVTNIESDLDNLNSRLAGNLVPELFDNVELSYVATGNGEGEIETVTYKTGGSAGSIVATLTLSYDAQNRLTSVTRS